MTIRTVDNLGVDVSVRYAKDRQQLDRRLVDDAGIVSQKTESISYKPYAASDFDARFFLGARQTSPLATFQPPTNYFQGGGNLFSYLLIPSLGSEEKLENDLEKVTYWSKQEEEKKKKSAVPSLLEEVEEEEATERQRKLLAALLKCITRLNRDLIFATACRNQYQKG